MDIHKKLILILKEVGAVEKGKTNQQQGYKFRGIDDMYNALHPLFSKHGVYITSEVLSSKREERQTQKGGILIHTIALCKFTLYAEDGTSVSSTTEGEAMDSGDKSTNKAMSTALKYALMQMFLIPTEEKLDTENESHQPVPKRPQLSDKLLGKAIERIKNGEEDVIGKLAAAFSITAEQQEELNSALNGKK